MDDQLVSPGDRESSLGDGGRRVEGPDSLGVQAQREFVPTFNNLHPIHPLTETVKAALGGMERSMSGDMAFAVMVVGIAFAVAAVRITRIIMTKGKDL